MHIKICHLHRSLDLNEASNNLRQAGLLSIKNEMAKAFNKGVSFLPVNIDPPISIPDNVEVFIEPNEQGLCHVEIEKDDNGSPIVNLHIIASDEKTFTQLSKLCNCLGEIEKAHLGTINDEMLVENTKKKVAKLSPNGKMLLDKNIGPILSKLGNPEIRACLRVVDEIFGSEAVPVEAIIESVQEKSIDKQSASKVKSVIGKLIREEKLFDKRHVIACEECGTILLEFPNKEAAEESLKHAYSDKCKVCDEGRVSVIEAYSCKDSFLKALEQGLWLEKLACDSLKPYCQFISAGCIADPSFELDVIAVFYDKVILFECKDTSFGQNDFITLSAAADEVNANVIGIITTRPLHENVERLIKRARDKTPREYIVIQNTDNPSEIISQIEKSIGEMQETYIKRLFIPSPEERLYRSMMRRRYLFARPG